MVAIGASSTTRGSSSDRHRKNIISRYFLYAASILVFINLAVLTHYMNKSTGWTKGHSSSHSSVRREKYKNNYAQSVTPDMIYNSRLKLQYQCTKSSSDLRDLISGTEQVIILTPAKAAGTALKHFAKACNGRSYSKLMDNFINFDFEHIVSNSYRMPPVITSHLYHVENLLYMIENTPRNALIIYVHREETKRLSSAINEVVTNWCRRGNGHPGVYMEPPEGFFYKEERNNCYVKESTLVNAAIKQKKHEMRFGATELLPCETFEAIKTNAPNMMFMDYKMGNQLQQLVAEKYCPHLADEPVESNVASEKEWEAFVQVKNTETVSLSSWLKVKQSTLEWALGLNHEATCRAKTRIMEDKLFSCKSGFLKTAVTED